MLGIFNKRFYNYQESPKRLPRVLWQLLRLSALAIFGATAWLVVMNPFLGNILLWGVIAPCLPILLMVAPGLWRNVCPGAIFNQIPRGLGFSVGLGVTSQMRVWCYGVAVTAFLVLTIINPLFNNNSFSLTLLFLGGFLAAAFFLGLLFEGKGGWCGTFCPLAPLERIWGSTPILNNRNAFCKTCVGCQKNCMDFNPRAAFISDFYDANQAYAGQRLLFVALLPGFFLGLFLQDSNGLANLSWNSEYFIRMGSYMMISIGVFHILSTYLPLSHYRLSIFFSLAGFGIFYYFMLPEILKNIDLLRSAIPYPELAAMLDFVKPETVTHGYIALSGLMTISLLISFVHGMRFSLNSMISDNLQSLRINIDKLHTHMKEYIEGMSVTEDVNKLTFTILEGQSILDALEHADFHIESGCRMGLCGSDPVAITDNEENFLPVSPEEADTLKRLGLYGQARLACMARVNGSVGISIDCFSRKARDLRKMPTTEIGWGMVDVPERKKSDNNLKDRKIVVIGNGVAGMSAVQYLRRLSPTADITVISNELHSFYNRMGLFKLLENHLYSTDNMTLLPPHWYEKYHIKQLLNTKVSRVDTDKKNVHFGQTDSVPYDTLVLALGAQSRIPDISGFSLEGCYTIRSMEDMIEINSYIQQGRVKNVSIIGGGWLGIEVAAALRKRNFNVTLIHAGKYLLNNLQNPVAAKILKDYLTQQLRITVMCQMEVLRVSGQNRAEQIHIAPLNEDKKKTGSDENQGFNADLCVFAIGTNANVDFVTKSSIRCGANGIMVNRKMQTSDDNIYAVGDCVDLVGTPLGIWGASMEMGKIAALNIANINKDFNTDMCYLPRILKIPVIDFRAFGKTKPDGQDRIFEGRDIVGNRYWFAVVNSENYVVGGIFVNHSEMSNSLYKAMRFRLNAVKLLPEDAAAARQDDTAESAPAASENA